MVHLHHVSVEYPRTKTLALYDVNLEVKKGEFVFLTGHSGAGKSTLLGLILRRVAPSNGTVHVDGQDLAGIRGNRLAQYRRKTGMVFQDHRLLEDYTVEENLSFVLRVQGADQGGVGKPDRPSSAHCGACPQEAGISLPAIHG